MQKGDILIIYKDNINSGTPIMIYDKNIGISADMWEIKLVRIDDVTADNNHIVIKPLEDTTWQKKKKLNEHMSDIITGKIKPSFRQRLHFLDYILWIYEELLDIKLLECPMPVTIENLMDSDKIRGNDA